MLGRGLISTVTMISTYWSTWTCEKVVKAIGNVCNGLILSIVAEIQLITHVDYFQLRHNLQQQQLKESHLELGGQAVSNAVFNKREEQPDSTEACLANTLDLLGPGPSPKHNIRSLDTHKYQQKRPGRNGLTQPQQNYYRIFLQSPCNTNSLLSSPLSNVECIASNCFPFMSRTNRSLWTKKKKSKCWVHTKRTLLCNFV